MQMPDSWARKPTILPPGEEGPSVPNFGDLDIGVVNAVMFGSGGGQKTENPSSASASSSLLR